MDIVMDLLQKNVSLKHKVFIVPVFLWGLADVCIAERMQQVPLTLGLRR